MLENSSFQSASFSLSESGVLQCTGQWTLAGLGDLKSRLAEMPCHADCVEIDGRGIEKMDSAGAVLLYECIQKVKALGGEVQQTFKKEHEALIHLVSQHAENLHAKLRPQPRHSLLYIIGKEAVGKVEHAIHFLGFFGEFSLDLLKELRNPFRIQWPSILNVVEETGYRALPIVALLLFLIGVVLTYQMGLQLKSYGANVFIVNLTGIAILREFSPLITAIIIAGRTSSAFTALISTMKVYEELDALTVMGLSPMSRIVVPRVIGLLISLPLLIIWASVFGVLGSMVMANTMLDITYMGFLQRFGEVVEFKEYWIGMSKAPAFALIISVIGCYQGLEGALSAESVGHQTTKSVVQAIFLIIIADAGFSVIYSWLGL